MNVARRAWLTISTIAFALLSNGAPSSAQVFTVDEAPGVSISSLFSSSVGSGARALAMGGAFIAVADDGTAASWNPAGLCVLEKPEASIVWQGIGRIGTVFSPTTSVGRRRLGGIVSSRVRRVEIWTVEHAGRAFDFASLAYPLRRRQWKFVPQFSFQRAINLGGESLLGTTAFRDTDANVDVLRLESDSVVTGNVAGNGSFSGGLDIYAASLGASFRDDLFFGVSFNWWRGDPVSDTTLQTDIEATHSSNGFVSTGESVNVLTESTRESFRGFNAHVGVLYRPLPKLRLGLVYKAPFELRRSVESSGATLDVSHEPVGSNVSRILSTTAIVHRTERGRIQWPRTLGFGAAFNPSSPLTLSTDFTWSEWSDVTYEASFRETRGSRAFCGAACQLPSGISLADLLSGTTGTSGVEPSVGERRLWPTGADPSQPEKDFNLRQVDTRQFRFGFEYMLVGPGLVGLRALPVRAGIFTDRQYFKQSNFTPVDFLGLTAGLGFVWTHLSIDLAYVHKSGSFRSRDRKDPTFPESFILEVADHDDKLSSNQLFVSAIMRF